jgi:hypothetical protein
LQDIQLSKNQLPRIDRRLIANRPLPTTKPAGLDPPSLISGWLAKPKLGVRPPSRLRRSGATASAI